MWKQDYIYPGLPQGPQNFTDDIEYGLKRLRDANPDNAAERKAAMEQMYNVDKAAFDAQQKYGFDVEPNERFRQLKHYGLDVPKELEVQNENARKESRARDKMAQEQEQAKMRIAADKYIAMLRERGANGRLNKRLQAEGTQGTGPGGQGGRWTPATASTYIANLRDPEQRKRVLRQLGYGGDGDLPNTWEIKPEQQRYLSEVFGYKPRSGGMGYGFAPKGASTGGGDEEDIYEQPLNK